MTSLTILQLLVPKSVHIHGAFLQKSSRLLTRNSSICYKKGSINHPLAVVITIAHGAQKKNPGDWHPCGNYLAPNNATTPDRYPIPHIQDFTVTLYGANIFSKLDLVLAYHQVPVKTTGIPKTAIKLSYAV